VDAPADIDDRFEVLETLGEGGTARVLRARHRTLGTEVALKLMTLGSDVMAQRLLAEGRAHALLAHRNVVQVLDVVTCRGLPGLVMELVEGPTLAELLRGGPLAPDEADVVVDGVLAGMEAAHAQGLVHRDLKPANVLLALDGGQVVPKVADFGLVKSVHAPDDRPALTHTDATLGTPAYMAPEQIRDPRDVDARADVFSLGALIYEVLAGVRCFRGDDGFQLLAAVVRGERVPLAERVEGLPDRMVAVVERALAVDRAERWPDVAAMRAAWRGVEAALPRSVAHGRLPTPRALAERVQTTWAARSVHSVHTSGATLASWVGSPLVVSAASEVPGCPGLLGRADELGRLMAARAGLWTLRGPGGVGKTRLAEAWAEARGVPVVACATAREPSQLLDRMVTALDLHGPAPGADAVVAQIEAALARPSCPGLVLDNVEQLLPAVGLWLSRWGSRAAGPLVVTSRVRAELPGEQVIDVGPLEEAAAVGLLAERLPPGVTVPEEELRALAHQLEGLPLVLELAAARLGTWDPGELRRRLAGDLSLLRTRGGGRHGSAWAAVAWSWELLDDVARSVLAQCTAFGGPFSVTDAEAVVVETRRPVWQVLEELEAASLLHVVQAPDAPRRLRMLVVTRHFAADQLAAMDDPRGPWRRHLAWAVAAGAARRARSEVRFDPAVHHAQRRLSSELVRAAKRCGDELPLLASRAVLARPELPAHRGDLAAHAAELDGVLAWTAGDDTPPEVRARALWLRGLVARLRGDGAAAARWLAQGRQLAQAHDLPGLLGRIEGQLGNLASMQGSLDEAERRYEAAVAVLEGPELRHQRAVFVGNLGIVAAQRGAHAEAVSRYREALAVFEDGGNPTNVGLFRANLSNMLFRMGHHEEAEAHAEQAMAWFERAGQRRRRAQLLANRAFQQLELGQLAQARSAITEALRDLSGREVPAATANAILTLGDVQLAMGEAAEAERSCRHALALSVSAGARRYEGIAAFALGRLARRDDLGVARAWLQRAVDRLAAVGDPEHLAYALLYLAVVHREAGRGSEAEAVWRPHDELLRRAPQTVVAAVRDIDRALRGEAVPLGRVWRQAAADHHLRWALQLLQR